MVDILDRNFEKDEYFRAKLINRVPKFGNNIGEVDELAEQVASAYCNEVKNIGAFEAESTVPGCSRWPRMSRWERWSAHCPADAFPVRP